MYGTIRKNYSESKVSKIYNDDNLSLFKKKKKEKKLKEKEDLQITRYMKIDNIKEKTNECKEEKKDNSIINIGKNEFPIAPVILTIVFTMMVMIFAFGFGGI